MIDDASSAAAATNSSRLSSFWSTASFTAQPITFGCTSTKAALATTLIAARVRRNLYGRRNPSNRIRTWFIAVLPPAARWRGPAGATGTRPVKHGSGRGCYPNGGLQRNATSPRGLLRFYPPVDVHVKVE